MDGLHNVMRSIRGETKARRGHLSVFREFLDHLDRAARRSTQGAPARTRSTARAKANGRPKLRARVRKG